MDPTDRAEVAKVIKKHFPLLKHISIFLQASSEYPGITMTHFATFLKACNLIDQLTTSTRVDQLYINSVLSLQNQSGTFMYRWSFLEFCLRLANDRYRERKVVANYAEAL